MSTTWSQPAENGVSRQISTPDRNGWMPLPKEGGELLATLNTGRCAHQCAAPAFPEPAVDGIPAIQS